MLSLLHSLHLVASPIHIAAQLFETYHGVFVNIQYVLQVDVPRSLLAKNLQKRLEFIVEVPVRCCRCCLCVFVAVMSQMLWLLMRVRLRSPGNFLVEHHTRCRPSVAFVT